jgi:hypothetical protein
MITPNKHKGIEREKINKKILTLFLILTLLSLLFVYISCVLQVVV